MKSILYISFINIVILLSILIIFYFIDKLLYKINYIENFTQQNNYDNTPILINNSCKGTGNNVLDKYRIIWMYWETMPNKTKPGYIDLCINSVKHNCSKCFDIRVLDNNTIYDYLPELKNIDLTGLNLPQKVDYYRYCLLEKYGGVWIDADILVLKCICPFYNNLENNDYVGFGCGTDTKTCKKTLNGYSNPTNWFMISKDNTKYIKCIKKRAEDKINKSILSGIKLPYHDIGKVILNECYNELNDSKISTDNNFKYHHISSKCQEYDTKGNKLNNIMKEFDWKDCINERIIFPLYNTAPGYPEWFKQLTFDELKTKNTYLKPLIDMAFSNKQYE